MEFGQIVAPTIKELFIERIEGMIFSGALKPGDRLPSERDLAEQMKISKTRLVMGASMVPSTWAWRTWRGWAL